MIVYSKSTNAFYLEENKPVYLEENTWPDDVIDVPASVFMEFSGEPPDGKIRVAGKSGLPEWGDIPAPSQDALIEQALAQKNGKIISANNFINNKQWPGKAAIGRLKDDEKQQYNLWLDYLDELESMELSAAPDIKWPEQPE